MMSDEPQPLKRRATARRLKKTPIETLLSQGKWLAMSAWCQHRMHPEELFSRVLDLIHAGEIEDEVNDETADSRKVASDLFEAAMRKRTA